MSENEIERRRGEKKKFSHIYLTETKVHKMENHDLKGGSREYNNEPFIH